MIKNPLFICVILLMTVGNASAQSFPHFLKGTWKVEGSETYEHWDRANANKLMGFSYRMLDGNMAVSEYLCIEQREDGIIYTATVLNENQGAGIDFMLTCSDSTYVFENPEHDFPKLIRYRPVSDESLVVEVGTQKEAFPIRYERVSDQ